MIDKRMCGGWSYAKFVAIRDVRMLQITDTNAQEAMSRAKGEVSMLEVAIWIVFSILAIAGMVKFWIEASVIERMKR